MELPAFCVIIAGGKGTRFWPLSRARRPKQLLRILGPKSLIAETVDRVVPLSGRDRLLVVTVSEQAKALRKELTGIPERNFIVEPEGRNTAPCIALAAIEIVRRSGDGVMIVLPADHWISDAAAFRQTLKSAVGLAQRHDQLITIGIRPDYPETGYGYIVRGAPMDGSGKVRSYRVRKFTEKPPLAAARRLVRRGSLWNSGIFVWKASTLLELVSRYQPAISRGIRAIHQLAQRRSLAGASPALRSALARAYRKMPALSIDYAVLEKAGSEGKVLALEAEFGWSDVGSWAAVHRMAPKDEHGIAGTGRWIGLGAKNCLVHAPDRLVALLGIEGAVIVDTPDALLVGDLQRSQEVRELVDALNRKGFRSQTIE